MLLGGITTPPLADQMDEAIMITVPAQPLGDSLRSLAKQANLQILFDPRLVANRSAPPVNGKMAPGDALTALLRESGLEALEQAPGVVVVRSRTHK